MDGRPNPIDEAHDHRRSFERKSEGNWEKNEFAYSKGLLNDKSIVIGYGRTIFVTSLEVAGYEQ